jgi:hypothetical protein
MLRATFGTRPSSSWGDAGNRAVDHSIYDKRRYPIVGVREGYGEWVRTYEQTVQDEMDLRLLERLRTVDWSTSRSVLDLGSCGEAGRGVPDSCPKA